MDTLHLVCLVLLVHHSSKVDKMNIAQVGRIISLHQLNVHIDIIAKLEGVSIGCIVNIMYENNINIPKLKKEIKS